MSSYDEAREAAFAQVMGSIDMPDDNTAEYDEWLFNAAIDAFLAKLSADGWKLVRREATEDMVTAGWAYEDGFSPASAFAAMWDAAPAMLAQEVKP